MYEKEILEVYEYCGIRSFPVDCDLILKKFGFDIVTYGEASGGDAEELRRMKAISNDGYVVPGEAKLYINEACYGKRQLFTKAHEIGHLVMVSDDEDVADAFASHLLIPRVVVYAEHLKTADEIAAFFGVSIAAANKAVVGMGSFSMGFFPDQVLLRILDHFGYRQQFPSLFIHYAEKYDKVPPSPFIQKLLQKDAKEKEREKKKQIRSLQGKIQRLRRKLMETRDEKEYYKAKNKLAEQQTRLDLLLGRSLDDY